MSSVKEFYTIKNPERVEVYYFSFPVITTINSLLGYFRWSLTRIAAYPVGDSQLRAKTHPVSTRVIIPITALKINRFNDLAS